MLSTSFTERPRLASFHTPGLGRRPAWRAEGVPLEPYRKLFQGTGVGLVLQGQIDDHTHPTCGDGVAPKQGHLLEQALCPHSEPSGPVVLGRPISLRVLPWILVPTRRTGGRDRLRDVQIGAGHCGPELRPAEWCIDRSGDGRGAGVLGRPPSWSK